MAEAGFYGVTTVGALMGAVGGSGGISGSRQAQLPGVVKTDSPVAPYTVANEYICGRLASVCGLPTPPGTIVKLDNDEYAYAMLRFGLNGEKPPPADVPAILVSKAAMAARIAVFDCWVLNGDRHGGNLAYIAGNLAMFDHGHALLGITADSGATYLQQHLDNPVWQGVLVGELASAHDLLVAAKKIFQVPEDVIREIVEDPRRLGLITRPEAQAVVAFLRARQARLSDYITNNKAAFPSVLDWGLQ